MIFIYLVSRVDDGFHHDLHSITYAYEVLGDVLVRVGGLLFPADFINLDMPEDSET